MTKLNFTLKTILVSSMLLSTLSVHGMENHEQLALQAKEYDDKYCLLINQLEDILITIVSHCVPNHNDKAKSLKESMKIFMRLSITYKSFHDRLTFETIGKLCKNYPQEDKWRALFDVQTCKYEIDRLRRLPVLILICAGTIDYHVLTKAALQNDIQLAKIVFKYHADPSTKMAKLCHQVFHAKTAEMTQIFIDNGCLGRYPDGAIHPNGDVNDLWHVVTFEHSAELLELYLKHNVNARRLRINNSCLLHALSSRYHANWVTNQKGIEDLLKKAHLLLKAIPDLINLLTDDNKTPLDFAYKGLKVSLKKERIHSVSAFKQLIALFKNNGGKTAQELAQQEVSLK